MKAGNGKLIVIEGLDGSGKATQTELLFNILKDKKQTVRKITFPVYSSPSSGAVKQYLAGDFGKNPEDVNAFAASAFYAVDRAASFLSDWKKDYESGATIVLDRYATSNIIYQMTKIKKENWEEFIVWAEDFEYEKIGIPKPSKVIYLDVAPIVSQNLMIKRYEGDKSKMDIHESDFEFLQKCRKAALFAAKYCGWSIINCTKDNKMKTIEEINNEIIKKII